MTWLARGKAMLLVAAGVGIGFNGLVGAVAPGRIEGTYDVEMDDPDVAVLLQHRAVLLALVGSGLVASAFRRELRPVALPSAALSMAAYVLLALTGAVNARQHRIAVADIVLLLLTAVAVATPERRSSRSC